MLVNTVNRMRLLPLFARAMAAIALLVSPTAQTVATAEEGPQVCGCVCGSETCDENECDEVNCRPTYCPAGDCACDAFCDQEGTPGCGGDDGHCGTGCGGAGPHCACVPHCGGQQQCEGADPCMCSLIWYGCILFGDCEDEYCSEWPNEVCGTVQANCTCNASDCNHDYCHGGWCNEVGDPPAQPCGGKNNCPCGGTSCPNGNGACYPQCKETDPYERDCGANVRCNTKCGRTGCDNNGLCNPEFCDNAGSPCSNKHCNCGHGGCAGGCAALCTGSLDAFDCGDNNTRCDCTAPPCFGPCSGWICQEGTCEYGTCGE